MMLCFVFCRSSFVVVSLRIFLMSVRTTETVKWIQEQGMRVASVDIRNAFKLECQEKVCSTHCSVCNVVLQQNLISLSLSLQLLSLWLIGYYMQSIGFISCLNYAKDIGCQSKCISVILLRLTSAVRAQVSIGLRDGLPFDSSWRLRYSSPPQPLNKLKYDEYIVSEKMRWQWKGLATCSHRLRLRKWSCQHLISMATSGLVARYPPTPLL